MEFKSLTLFERIPAEIGCEIFQDFSDQDLNAVCRVSKSLFQTVRDGGHWAKRAKSENLGLRWSYAKNSLDLDKTNYAITKCFFCYLQLLSRNIHNCQCFDDNNKEIKERNKNFVKYIRKSFGSLMKTVLIIKLFIEADLRYILQKKISSRLQRKIKKCSDPEFSGDLFALALFTQKTNKLIAANLYFQFFDRFNYKISNGYLEMVNKAFPDIFEMWADCKFDEKSQRQLNDHVEMQLNFYTKVLLLYGNASSENIIRKANSAAFFSKNLERSIELLDHIIAIQRRRSKSILLASPKSLEILGNALMDAAQKHIILKKYEKSLDYLNEANCIFKPLVELKKRQVFLMIQYQKLLAEQKWDEIPGEALLLFAIYERDQDLERASFLFNEAFESTLPRNLLGKYKKAGLVEFKLQRWNKAADYFLKYFKIANNFKTSPIISYAISVVIKKLKGSKKAKQLLQYRS